MNGVWNSVGIGKLSVQLNSPTQKNQPMNEMNEATHSTNFNLDINDVVEMDV